MSTDTVKIRRLFFGKLVNINTFGLEIGPSYAPTFPKMLFPKFLTLDHCDTENLIAKYKQDGNVSDELVGHIETVDFVYNGEKLDEISNIPKNFEVIVACHVIEHTLDLVSFLCEVSNLLVKDGHLLLAIPNRDLMFDYYRPLTTLGDVKIANLNRELYDVKAEIDEIYLASTLDNNIAWNSAAYSQINDINKPKFMRSQETVSELLRKQYEPSNIEKSYRDGHRWVFNPETFADIINMLAEAQLIDFNLAEWQTGLDCEFLVILRKSQKSPSSDFRSAYRPTKEVRSAKDKKLNIFRRFKNKFKKVINYQNRRISTALLSFGKSKVLKEGNR